MLVLLAAAACATATPRTFRFASNLDAARALACATAQLRSRGFDVSAAAEELAATALQRRRPAAGRPAEWWHVEVSVTPQGDGSTLVESVAGAGANAEGPFGAPPDALVSAVAEIPSRCTFP